MARGRNKRPNILIADDQYEMRKFLKDWLQSKGYRTSAAKDRYETIEQLSKERFNLALVDLKMPEVKGLELIHDIQKVASEMPIIIITGHPNQDTAMEAIRANAYDYMTKPLDMDHLSLSIQRALERERLTAQKGQLLQKLERSNKKLNKKIAELEEVVLGTITALAATIDARNHHTEEHSKQVTRYTLSVARRLRLPKRQREILRYACQFHDLGKVAIPDTILTKRSSLTEEEWVKVRRHPGEAADILSSLGFLRDAIPLVKHHHERYDGDGYPDKLKGEDIFLGARIIAIADAFDAMTSKRPYREALSREQAIRELREKAGAQFDPKLVKVFLKVLEKETQ